MPFFFAKCLKILLNDFLQGAQSTFPDPMLASTTSAVFADIYPEFWLRSERHWPTSGCGAGTSKVLASQKDLRVSGNFPGDHSADLKTNIILNYHSYTYSYALFFNEKSQAHSLNLKIKFGFLKNFCALIPLLRQGPPAGSSWMTGVCFRRGPKWTRMAVEGRGRGTGALGHAVGDPPPPGTVP